MAKIVTNGRPDGTIEVRPDDNDYGLSIRPEGKRFALYGRQGKWFECDTADDCIDELLDIIEAGKFEP